MGRHLPPCRDLTKGFFTQGSRSESVGMLMLELKNRAGKNTEHVQTQGAMFGPTAAGMCSSGLILPESLVEQYFVGSYSSEEGLVMDH